jgi:threonine dehydrogenase-like Zn-dependent dehydrogenase
MRQLTYVAPGKVEWWDVPEPRLQGDAEALVRPLAVTRCDLDRLIVTGALGWTGPFALGHEMTGLVTDVGSRVATVQPGDRVIVPFQISCGACPSCRRGHTGNCETVGFRSSYGMAPLSGKDFGGALSDLVRVPFADHMLLRCPSEIASVAGAAVADTVSDAFRSVAPYLAVHPHARVLIVGGLAQGLGIYIAEAARALSASEVLYLDDDPLRLQLARKLQVHVVERTTYEGVAPGSPYLISIDASGTTEGLGLAIRSTAHGGTCHRTYGDLRALTPVPLRDMYSIGLNLHLSRVHARTVMSEVVEHVRRRHLHPEIAITRTVSFAQAAEAIFDSTIKVAFINDGAQ